MLVMPCQQSRISLIISIFDLVLLLLRCSCSMLLYLSPQFEDGQTETQREVLTTHDMTDLSGQAGVLLPDWIIRPQLM